MNGSDKFARLGLILPLIVTVASLALLLYRMPETIFGFIYMIVCILLFRALFKVNGWRNSREGRAGRSEDNPVSD